MTPAGRALLGAMRRNFELLIDLEKTAPDDVSEIVEAAIQHFRSWKPMALLGLPSMDETPTPLIRREVEGGIYELAREDGKVWLYVCEGSHDTAVALTPLAAIRLRADIAAVAASIPASEQATVAQGGG